MKTRDLAAGVICVGFDGTSLTPQIEADLRRAPLAGVILFGRNTQTVEQTRALTEALRNCFMQRSPIIAIDQEGGRVVRIREGIEHIPSMMTLAATGRPELAHMAGEQTAHDLRRIGANVDFAPVLDLALYSENTVIGTRSFGEDPKTVIAFGAAFARGLQAAGVVATYKHFPGHGSTALDTHLELPRVTADASILRSRDLLPFAALLPGARAVMTAHIVVEAFDPERPATLSSRILTGLLRDEIGFRGVCFTDCMQMDAIAKSVGTAEGAVLALEAGADCVLISHSVDLALEAVDRITEAVERGRIPLLRLQHAYERVSELQRSLAAPIAVDAPPLYPGISESIAKAAVTLVRGTARIDPSNAFVVSFQGTTTEGAQGTQAHHASLGANGDGVQQLVCPLEPAAHDVDDMMLKLKGAGRNVAVISRRAHIHKAQAAAIESILRAFPDALLVSMREPFDVAQFPQARNVLALYGDDAPNMTALRHAIFDGADLSGRLPVGPAAVR